MTQLVLTPETAWEKSALKHFGEGEKRIEVKRGSFYECQGGWTRFSPSYHTPYGRQESDDSLIFRVQGLEPVLDDS